MMILNKVLKKIGWIPLLTGTGIYGIMLLTDSKLILQEYHQIKQLLRQEATTVEWVMNHQITSRRKGLELMVDRQEIRGGMIKNEGELNPKNYIQQKETKNLKIDEREFQVILARSSSLSQNVKSPLSTVILLGGLMIGLSSALTLYFARSSKLKSKQLEEINQKLILQIQKEAATQAVESGLEALTLLVQDKGFDLAILDMQMPQMDGLSLANCIHALPSTQHLPLVLLISVGHFLPQDTASKKLFAASLTKPIKQSQIYNTLAQILSNQPTTIQFFPTSKPQYSPLEETLYL